MESHNPTEFKTTRGVQDPGAKCRAAKALASSGDYEAAREALGDLWGGIGQRPEERELMRVTVFAFLLFAGPLLHSAQAQQVKMEGVFPRQWPRGQEIVVHVAVQNQNPIQTVEVSPSDGVKVSGITKGEDFQGAYTWSELHIAVAADASPGKRTLVVVVPAGRTVPVTITIPEHVPVISDLRVARGQSSGSGLDVEIAAADPSGDLGESPYLWFMVGCGAEIVPGVVYGNVLSRD